MEYTGPKINGVPTQSIAKRSGIPVNMISKLCGIDATLIGLPGHFTGPTCMTIDATYSDTSIEAAYFGGTYGTQLNKVVDLDDTNGALYLAGSCGDDTKYAPGGYYALQIPNGDIAPEGMPPPTNTLFAYWDDVDLKLDTSVRAKVNLTLAYAEENSAALCTDTNKSNYFYFLGPMIDPNRLPAITLMTISEGNETAAAAGYYSNGVTIYSNLYDRKFDQVVFVDTEVPCQAAGPTILVSPTWELVTYYNLSGPTFDPITQPTIEITSELLQARANAGVTNGGDGFGIRFNRGTWTGAGDISYTYVWSMDDTVISTDGPYPYINPKDGQLVDSPTSQSSFGIPADLYKTISCRITATDQNGSTSFTLSLQIVDPVLNRFLANSGITGESQIQALKYFRKEMLAKRWDGTKWFNFDSVIKDYYPIAGTTQDENKWSLRNPDQYLNFRYTPGSVSYYDTNAWTHSSVGMVATSQSPDNWVESTLTNTYTADSTLDGYGFFFGYYSADDLNTAASFNGYEDIRLAGFAWHSTYGPGVQGCNDGKAILWRYLPTFNSVGWRGTCVPTYLSGGVMVTYGAAKLNGMVVRNLSSIYQADSIRVSGVLEGALIDYYQIATNTQGLSSSDLTSPIRLGGMNTSKRIQFVISGQLPSANYGDSYFMNQLNTILKNYNDLLGR